MAARWLPLSQGPHHFRIHTDTTDFFRVEYGDVVILGGKPYLIRHNAKEGRFGVDDEVKFWVKRAIDLETGILKIIKLVFYETFKARIGEIEFECFRSPKKEARILIRAGFAPEDVSVRSTLRYCPSLAECILAERDQTGYSTIVVGRQGLSRSEEFLFGSVSSKIVNHARDCTVWVVE